VIAEPALLDVLDDPDFTSARDPARADDALVEAVTRARRRWRRRACTAARQAPRVPPYRAARPPRLADLATSAASSALSPRAASRPRSSSPQPTIPFAIVGMGKLGGAELNYASDVDVLFVHDGDGKEADRIARAVLSTMTTQTADGIVFRTDADLRPEGRAGALSRTVDSYEAWWARWARHWEYQALIKARPVAGDADLGDKFMETSRAFVWRDVLDADAIREVAR
jgi:glutamate-ammonia-ligase adenylyltransferase